MRRALLRLLCRYEGHALEVLGGTEGTSFETAICRRCGYEEVVDGRVLT